MFWQNATVNLPWISACILLAASLPLRANSNYDLPRLFPAGGNTVYPAAKLLHRWPADGPRLLWQTEIGGGRSGVVESKGLAFTASQFEGTQWALCLDPKTGKVLWKHALIAKENHHNVMTGPEATPVIDGDRVYFVPYEAYQNDLYDPRCPVICLKADGTELWRESEKFWVTEGSTPLVVGDALYLASSGSDHLFASVDKLTGKLRWGTPFQTDAKRFYAGACSVTYQETAGIPQIVGYIWGPNLVVGVDARDGHILWKWPQPGAISSGLVSTPVAVGNRLLFSGAQQGAFLLCLEMVAKDGGLQPRQVYSFHDRQGNTIHTLSVHDNAVFGFYGTGSSGAMQCTDLADGKLLWDAKSDDWMRAQNLIVADGLIYALTQHNELVMAEAARKGYHELGRVKLPAELGKFPQQPMIANGHLYIRGDKQVLCYQVAE